MDMRTAPVEGSPEAPPGLEWVLPAVIIVGVVFLAALIAWFMFVNRRR